MKEFIRRGEQHAKCYLDSSTRCGLFSEKLNKIVHGVYFGLNNERKPVFYSTFEVRITLTLGCISCLSSSGMQSGLFDTTVVLSCCMMDDMSIIVRAPVIKM